MRRILPFILIFYLHSSYAQDSAYARACIRFLTSEKCYGRGYLKNGLKTAEKFLLKNMKAAGLQPLFNSGFTQTFTHPVNTFPKHCDAILNGKALRAGYDFIPDPASASAKGKFRLLQQDSTHYTGGSGSTKVLVSLNKKLTFSVSGAGGDVCLIELDRNAVKDIPEEIELNIESVLVPDFKSRNLAGFIKGSSNADSMIVFSAHYDHLGGIGRHTFFPGANDNASGTSLLLDLMRYYKTHPPRYKTVFIFFAGEEAGLLGSHHFCGSQAIDLKKIKFLINLDLLGTGDDGIMVVNGAVHEKEFRLLTKVNEEKGLVKQVRQRGKARNSDHYWFSEAGVPCFFIYTLGGVTAYHDVRDIERTLPLTDYPDVFTLITTFVGRL